MTKLVCLTKKNKETIANSEIICFEKSKSYLKELNCKYPDVFGRISYIVEPNPRYQGELEADGRKFDVVGCDVLTQNMSSFAKKDMPVILITSDYYKEAYDKILKLFEASEGKGTAPEEIYYFPNKETEIELAYREKYADEPLQNIIVFRSGPHASSYVKGLDFADNARALFEYMLSVGLNKKYELVWIVKDPDEFNKKDGKHYDYCSQYRNLTFVAFEDSITSDIVKRDEYYRVLCLAKWIFMTDAYGFCRNARQDQVRVQLWHGCGFKTRTNFVPCEKRYEYNIVIGELYKKIHADIYGLRDDQVIITGYPKSDWIFHRAAENIAEKLGIISPITGNDSFSDYKFATEKIVFWLPTFRIAKENLSELHEHTLSTGTGMPLVENVDQLKLLDDCLRENNIRLVIKLHPFQDKGALSGITEDQNLKNIVLIDNEQLVDEDVQIGQLLAYADALISDYSSVAVEYLLLGRPVAFTLDDAKEYENSRGFVFENIREWLPGKELYSFDDYLEFVREIAEGIDTSKNKRERITACMHQYVDDKSCERVVEMLGI